MCGPEPADQGSVCPRACLCSVSPFMMPVSSGVTVRLWVSEKANTALRPSCLTSLYSLT